MEIELTTNTDTKKKWFKYLSDQENENIKPFLTDYFNDNIDFEELNHNINQNGLLNYKLFKKGLIIESLFLS